LIEIFFLGTGGTVPSPLRGLPSIVLRRRGEIFMFDCGEGTQFRYMSLHLGVNKRMRIFITHLHGDHVLGLPGLLMTFSVLGREKPLEIYGPQGIKELIDKVFSLTNFIPEYEVKIVEVNSPSIIVKERDYFITTDIVDHTVTTFAYSLEEYPKPGRFNPQKAISLGVPKGPLWKKLQLGYSITLPNGRVVRPEDVLEGKRPGMKIVYSGDTRPCSSLIKLATNASLLIHDSTFPSDLKEKAKEAGHSTVEEACRVAIEANVQYLVLFHLSARIVDTVDLLRKAKEFFEKSIVAEDYMKIEMRDGGVTKVENLRDQVVQSRQQVNLRQSEGLTNL